MASFFEICAVSLSVFQTSRAGNSVKKPCYAKPESAAHVAGFGLHLEGCGPPNRPKRFFDSLKGHLKSDVSACRKSPPAASFSEIYAVSLSPPWGSRAGNSARKPCTARLPNPPHMSPDSDCIWRALALQTSRKGFLTVWDIRNQMSLFETRKISAHPSGAMLLCIPVRPCRA